MHFESGKLIFSPSDLVGFLYGDFATWMDRWHAEKHAGDKSVVNHNGLPRALKNDQLECVPDSKDDELRLIAEMGLKHERAFLQGLLDDGEEVEIIPDDLSKTEQIDRTLNAMRRGVPYIYQGRLHHEEFQGIADFLVRQSGASNFGQHFYEAWDTKLARSFKPYFVIQLCSYSDMLDAAQGKRPESFSVVLGNGRQEQRLVRQFLYYFRSIRRRFLSFHEKFSADNFPHPGLSASHGRWSAFAQQYLVATDHLSLVANITSGQIKKLEADGITTLTKLATTRKANVPRMAQPLLRRLKLQAQLQLKSKELDKPLFQVGPTDPTNSRRGLALLPPASPQDVFFDIEGYPLAKDGLEYLLGVVCCEKGKLKFLDWWSHDQQQERCSFQAFVDWLYGRWKANPSMHVYHYSAYETTALRRLMGKHATREREVDDLLRNQVFVDLYTVVRQGLTIGTTGYSLKDIEVLFSEQREGEVTTAGGSIVAYHSWIESGESQQWKSSPLLNGIRDYNQVDCESTYRLAEWLWKLQQDNAIEYVPPPSVNDETQEVGETAHQSTQLAEKLLQQVNERHIADPAKARVQELLAHLLEYHWREAKPVFWRMFDRAEMDDQELIDDLDCLGGLARTSTAPRQIKRSLAFEYMFDPDQDTKLRPGSSCTFAHDLSVGTTIESFDGERGIIEIKLGPKKETPPDQLNLIPNEYVSAKLISDAVFRFVDAWSQGTTASQAVDDLLFRRSPRLKGHKDGPIISDDQDLVPQTVDAVSRMNKTVLCIQGPPGSGKTFTAAKSIAALIQSGKRVGVTSNSHKSVINILRAVFEAMKAERKKCRIVKVGSTEEDSLIEQNLIEHVESNSNAAVALGKGPLVMGGTAWLFCRPELQGAFDYLFIDEAGQFSLANTVAVGMSSRNLVLVGDQMQLAQPTLGTHPGVSGHSSLNYLLDGHATIPSEIGIFLDQTWRLHPDICDFVSQAVYEGRLRNHPQTARQRIETKGALITKDAGILFVPVEHEGSSQGCDEEVVVIDKLVKELVGGQVWDAEKPVPRILAMDDILIVAPFNMQVRLLKQRLGPTARIGSVDKFQGQEAHVVIISMCSSSLDDSPRGAEFLFDPNRLNVAVSRAKSLAIVVGSPNLSAARCNTIREMELANLFCWLVDYSGGEA